MRGLRSMPVLTCADVRSVSEFFTGGLGFSLAGAWEEKGETSFAIVVLDAVTVALQRGEARPQQGWSAYLYVSDVDTFAASIAGRGVNLARGPEDAFYGCREIEVETPEGHLLCLATDLQPSESGPGL